MTPEQFIEKWSRADRTERQAAQEHFIDLCGMLGEPTPNDASVDPDSYSFEKGATKIDGSGGFADVWKRGCFGWEYKKDRANLDRAYQQLQLYSVALENPPLLVVSDTKRFRIYTARRHASRPRCGGRRRLWLAGRYFPRRTRSPNSWS
jgi:MmeI, N-terminal domain